MWTMSDSIEEAARLMRESQAPGIAGMWGLIGFVVAAILIRVQRDSFGVKLGASLLAVGGAAGTLLWWSVQPEQAHYYKFVDEAVAEAPRLRRAGRLVDVNGVIVPGSIHRRLGTDEYRFRLESRPDRAPAVIEVRYTGLVPDTFRSGNEIVALGKLVGDGGLDVVPDGIMAKCPSKYAADIPDEWERVEPGS
jgi:cytochrome c-type biogenesis protein CcmE